MGLSPRESPTGRPATAAPATAEPARADPALTDRGQADRGEAVQTAPLVVSLLPALSDNYIPLLQRGRQAVVVDPGEAAPVARALEQEELSLSAILHTHHHSDHIGGSRELLQRWPGCRVIAAAADRERIPFQTEGVGDGERFSVLGEPVEVLALPGHTRAHLAFWMPGPRHLFCGDTLFVAGCGRLFEGTPAQMHASLQRLASLPPDTQVWCAHEYSLANLRWAAAVVDAHDPGAVPIRERLATVQEQRARGRATVPTTIAAELATNLFLRAPDAGTLARLREHKDHWRG